MKILMIGAYPRGGEVRGGVEAVSYNLVEGFKEQHDAEILFLSFSHALVPRIETEQAAQNVRLRFCSDPAFLNKRRFYAGKGRDVVDDCIREFNPDIIHFQGNGPQLLLSLNLDPGNVVVTQHGVIIQEMKHQPNLKGKLIYLINEAIDRFCMRRIRHFIFISSYNQRALGRTPKGLSAIIPNPVNPLFREVREEPGTQNRLLFIGGITPAKGIDVLLGAVSKLKRSGRIYDVLLAGHCNKTYQEKLTRFCVENSIKDQVRFLGVVSPGNLAELYREIPVMVLPSRQECLPVSIAEAMSAGRVVVATSVGGIPEMIRDGENGFLFPGNDAGKLAEKLDILYDSAALRKRISEEARNSSELYNRRLTAEKTLAFYKSVIKQNRI